MHTPGAPLHIGRLRMRAPASQLAQVRARIATELARADWPEDEGIVVLRQLSARGHLSELPARAADAATRLIHRAVPADNGAASSSDAVRFRDALDYRACLLGDLLDGCAQQRWHWRHRHALLSLPLAQAVAELLGEAPLQLLALLDHPRLHRQIPALWAALDRDSAGTVLDRLGAATGWTPALHQARNNLGSGEPAQSGPAEAGATPPSTVPPWNGQRTNDGSELSRLIRPQDRLPPSAAAVLTPEDPRALLPAVLLLWRRAPARLSAAEASTHLRELAAELLRPAAGPQRAGPVPPLVPNPRPHSKEAPAPALPAQAHRSATPLAPASQSGQASPPDSVPEQVVTAADPASANAGPTPPRPPFGVTVQPESTGPSPPDAARPVTSAGESSETEFSTRFGGSFFLLNALNLPALQPDRLLWVEPQAGWRHWLRLIRSLDGELDAGLESFLARACAVEMSEVEPPAPTQSSARVLDAALGRFGPAALAAALTPRPARVTCDASHLHVHLHLADIDLDIRRCGLDIDPGWLPWLGRVVRFHYD